jgi:hypothetical protein
MTTILFSSAVAHVPWPSWPATATGAFGLLAVLALAAFVVVQGFQSVSGILHNVVKPLFYLSLFFVVAVAFAAR